jgi:hypothetical protein
LTQVKADSIDERHVLHPAIAFFPVKVTVLRAEWLRSVMPARVVARVVL